MQLIHTVPSSNNPTLYGAFNPSATVVVITGDRDFQYALQKLKDLGHDTMLLCHNNAHRSLKDEAYKCISWEDEVLARIVLESKYCGGNYVKESDEESDSDFEYYKRHFDDEHNITPPSVVQKPYDSGVQWHPTPPGPRSASNCSTESTGYVRHPSTRDTMLPPSSAIHAGRSTHTTVVHLPPFDKVFLDLLTCLTELNRAGIDRPLRSVVASRLGRSAHTRVGFSKFRDWSTVAEQVGFVRLGGSGGQAWISLHPNWIEHL